MPTGAASSPSILGVNYTTRSWPVCCPKLRDWRGATDESRAAIRLNPARVQTRQLLVRCELHLKNPEAARKEFQTLLGFDPPNRDELIRWFAPLVPDQGGRP